MADTTLFNVSVEAGAELVREMDRRGMPPEIAAWLYDSDHDRWRLLVQVGAPHDQRAAIREVIDILGARDDIANAVAITDIRVATAGDDMADAVRLAVHTGPGVTQRPFGPAYSNGYYLDRGLAYRSVAPESRSAA